MLLTAAVLLTSCTGGNGNNPDNGGTKKPDASPFPGSAFQSEGVKGVIGSIVQTGDGNAVVSGTVPAPQGGGVSAVASQEKTNSNKHLVTLSHNFGIKCYVSGYIGNSLYVIQDFGDLAWNKKGVGHMDGTVLLDYGEDGYFSISSFSENKIIVGNPTDETTKSLWDSTDSYRFGYMTYDADTRTFTPMYEDDNLRFYTAGYFMGGVALVSVKENDKILFGIIDEQGSYVVEPSYEMMADEIIDGAVIVAQNATGVSTEFFTPNDTCGRNIVYDSTLMTNVQGSRRYECSSQTVGLIDTVTGESILPCNYAYVERVMNNTYFLIDNEGKSFLYDRDADSFTEVAEGVYTYFNSDWMLYVTANDTSYLADKELKLYETTGLEVGDLTSNTYINAKNRINCNILSAVRDEGARVAAAGGSVKEGLESEYDLDARVYTVTVTATGDVLENVDSFTEIFNGGFLYAKGNSLYRYDIDKRDSTRIETGYGNYTEDYEGVGERYYTSISELDTGIYLLRYNIEMTLPDMVGTSYHMVIINDKGAVLFDAEINAVEKLCKNYLGKYDAPLYELAGSTNIEDNYFLTRSNGAHLLIQFVRGELDGSVEGEENELDTVRRVDRQMTISLLSPFMLDFTDGSNITVEINGKVISADGYVYDSASQSLKVLRRGIDDVAIQKMKEDGSLEIKVTAGGETRILRIDISPFAIEF